MVLIIYAIILISIYYIYIYIKNIFRVDEETLQNNSNLIKYFTFLGNIFSLETFPQTFFKFD